MSNVGWAYDQRMVYSPVERITNLLTLLLETRAPLTLRDISNRLGAMYPDGIAALRGAFERDKALLREIGVPIETEVLGGGQAGETGYSINRDRYELRGLQLDDDERHALQMAVATVRSEAGQDAVWKLGGSVLPPSTVRANFVGLSPLPVLRVAATDHTSVQFGYRGSERTLDPYGLLLREGLWYVVGHDHLRSEVRTYRVDRIEGEVNIVEGSSFERPAGFDARSAFPADSKLMGDGEGTAQVTIFGPEGDLTRRVLGDDAVLSADVGIAGSETGERSVTFTVPCANFDAFRSWVLSFGVNAEVVGPPDVRARVVDWLTSCAVAK
jgi:predicted DNA-binding transcriptional regulator YafY